MAENINSQGDYSVLKKQLLKRSRYYGWLAIVVLIVMIGVMILIGIEASAQGQAAYLRQTEFVSEIKTLNNATNEVKLQQAKLLDQIIKLENLIDSLDSKKSQTTNPIVNYDSIRLIILKSTFQISKAYPHKILVDTDTSKNKTTIFYVPVGNHYSNPTKTATQDRALKFVSLFTILLTLLYFFRYFNTLSERYYQQFTMIGLTVDKPFSFKNALAFTAISHVDFKIFKSDSAIKTFLHSSERTDKTCGCHCRLKCMIVCNNTECKSNNAESTK